MEERHCIWTSDWRGVDPPEHGWFCETCFEYRLAPKICWIARFAIDLNGLALLGHLKNVGQLRNVVEALGVDFTGVPLD